MRLTVGWTLRGQQFGAAERHRHIGLPSRQSSASESAGRSRYYVGIILVIVHLLLRKNLMSNGFP